MSYWYASGLVAVVAIGTYLMRAGLILGLADRTVPEPVQRGLRQVGPAVLSALVVSLIAGTEGAAGVELAEVAALAAAGATAWWRRNLVASLAAGMITLWVLEALL